MRAPPQVHSRRLEQSGAHVHLARASGALEPALIGARSDRFQVVRARLGLPICSLARPPKACGPIKFVPPARCLSKRKGAGRKRASERASAGLEELARGPTGGARRRSTFGRAAAPLNICHAPTGAGD